VLISSGAFWLLNGIWGLNGQQIILVLGILNALGFIGLWWALPDLCKSAMCALFKKGLKDTP
jgi:hypothetical protein